MARSVEVVSAKGLWQKMLDLRMQTGEPYFIFIDTANHESYHEWLKDDKGLKY
jgi:ribonucleoside-diphosphate reductase alpha chain